MIDGQIDDRWIKHLRENPPPPGSWVNRQFTLRDIFYLMTTVAVISAAIAACMGKPANQNTLITKRPAGAGLP